MDQTRPLSSAKFLSLNGFWRVDATWAFFYLVLQNTKKRGRKDQSLSKLNIFLI